MSASQSSGGAMPNGLGAAAVLAAGIGSGALGVFALANDAIPAVGHFFAFYPPSGGLSGVSTCAIIVWLVAWFILARRWSGRTVAMAKVNLAAFVLLAVGVLLTFPPVMDLIQGR
jgi:asparagine N-glycosylation enzyme membrane subunit Stt3